MGEQMSNGKSSKTPSPFGWLKDKNWRELIGFIASGVAALAGAAWAAFTYFNKPASTLEATYQVCVGQYQERRPPNTVFLPCGVSVAAWATKECDQYTAARISDVSGNKCGYAVTQIKCVTNR
jgi:hypothetical protein